MALFWGMLHDPYSKPFSIPQNTSCTGAQVLRQGQYLAGMPPRPWAVGGDLRIAQQGKLLALFRHWEGMGVDGHSLQSAGRTETVGQVIDCQSQSFQENFDLRKGKPRLFSACLPIADRLSGDAKSLGQFILSEIYTLSEFHQWGPERTYLVHNINLSCQLDNES